MVIAWQVHLFTLRLAASLNLQNPIEKPPPRIPLVSPQFLSKMNVKALSTAPGALRGLQALEDARVAKSRFATLETVPE